MADDDRPDAPAVDQRHAQYAQTVVARAVLLDALEALGPHSEAVILVGAQAVYLHTKTIQLAVAGYTFDGDIVIDPDRITDDPRIEEAMTSAHFVPAWRGGSREPGMWEVTRIADGRQVTVPVDLIVPEAFAINRGNRSVTVGAHDRMSLRWTRGLEATLVDNSRMTIEALDLADARSMEVRVAGPASLIIAKLHKLHDRLQSGQRPDRLRDKDAADVYRLMQLFPPDLIADRWAGFEDHELIQPVVSEARTYLVELFGAPRSGGTNMAVDALTGAISEGEVRAVARAWVSGVTG